MFRIQMTCHCLTRWGDGYRRLQTDMYHQKLEDGTMELLNTY